MANKSLHSKLWVELISLVNCTMYNIDFDSKVLQKLLNKGADVNYLNYEGHNIISYFLEDWSFINTYEDYDSFKDFFDLQVNAVKLLFELGVNPNFIYEDENYFYNSYYSRNYKLIKIFAEAGTDINKFFFDSKETILDFISSDLHFKNLHNDKEIGLLYMMQQEYVKYGAKYSYYLNEN